MKTMARSEAAEKQAAVCRIFSNSRRILIMWTLAQQERPVSEIAKAIGASLPNTSQHLRLMKTNGILESRREGQTIYYRLADNDILEVCGLFAHAKKESNHDNG